MFVLVTLCCYDETPDKSYSRVYFGSQFEGTQSFVVRKAQLQGRKGASLRNAGDEPAFSFSV